MKKKRRYYAIISLVLMVTMVLTPLISAAAEFDSGPGEAGTQIEESFGSSGEEWSDTPSWEQNETQVEFENQDKNEYTENTFEESEFDQSSTSEPELPVLTTDFKGKKITVEAERNHLPVDQALDLEVTELSEKDMEEANLLTAGVAFFYALKVTVRDGNGEIQPSGPVKITIDSLKELEEAEKPAAFYIPEKKETEKDIKVTVNEDKSVTMEVERFASYLLFDEAAERIPEATPTPEPTATPEPTPTPEPTATPEPTPTPGSTEAPEPSPTPKPTEAPEPNPMPKPTEAPEPSPTPKPTEMPKPSPTPKPTEAPEPSPTPKPTEAPEPSPIPTVTPEPTETDSTEPEETRPAESKPTEPEPTDPTEPEPTEPSEPKVLVAGYDKVAITLEAKAGILKGSNLVFRAKQPSEEVLEKISRLLAENTPYYAVDLSVYDEEKEIQPDGTVSIRFDNAAVLEKIENLKAYAIPKEKSMEPSRSEEISLNENTKQGDVPVGFTDENSTSGIDGHKNSEPEKKDSEIVGAEITGNYGTQPETSGNNNVTQPEITGNKETPGNDTTQSETPTDTLGEEIPVIRNEDGSISMEVEQLTTFVLTEDLSGAPEIPEATPTPEITPTPEVTPTPEPTPTPAPTDEPVKVDASYGGTAIAVAAEPGVLPASGNLSLEAKEPSAEVLQKVKQAVGESEAYYVVDLSIKDGETSIQPNGTVKVTFEDIEALADVENLVAYYVPEAEKDTGTTEPKNPTESQEPSGPQTPTGSQENAEPQSSAEVTLTSDSEEVPAAAAFDAENLNLISGDAESGNGDRDGSQPDASTVETSIPEIGERVPVTRNEDGSITIEASHFSAYAIMEEPQPQILEPVILSENYNGVTVTLEAEPGIFGEPQDQLSLVLSDVADEIKAKAEALANQETGEYLAVNISVSANGRPATYNGGLVKLTFANTMQMDSIAYWISDTGDVKTLSSGLEEMNIIIENTELSNYVLVKKEMGEKKQGYAEQVKNRSNDVGVYSEGYEDSPYTERKSSVLTWTELIWGKVDTNGGTLNMNNGNLFRYVGANIPATDLTSDNCVRITTETYDGQSRLLLEAIPDLYLNCNLKFDHVALETNEVKGGEHKIYARGRKLVIGENVTTEKGVLSAAEKGVKWKIFGGSRTNENTTKRPTNIVVNDGKWWIVGGGGEESMPYGGMITIRGGEFAQVYGGGSLGGNVGTYGDEGSGIDILIQGGKIEKLFGGSRMESKDQQIYQNILINVEGGEIRELYATNDYSYAVSAAQSEDKVHGDVTVNLNTAGRVTYLYGDPSEGVLGKTELNINVSDDIEDMDYWEVVKIHGKDGNSKPNSVIVHNKHKKESGGRVGNVYVGRIEVTDGGQLWVDDTTYINYAKYPDGPTKPDNGFTEEYNLKHAWVGEENEGSRAYSTLKVDGNCIGQGTFDTAVNPAVEIFGSPYRKDGGNVEGYSTLDCSVNPKYSTDTDYYYYVVAKQSDHGGDAFKEPEGADYIVCHRYLKDGRIGWYIRERPKMTIENKLLRKGTGTEPDAKPEDYQTILHVKMNGLGYEWNSEASKSHAELILDTYTGESSAIQDTLKISIGELSDIENYNKTHNTDIIKNIEYTKGLNNRNVLSEFDIILDKTPATIPRYYEASAFYRFSRTENGQTYDEVNLSSIGTGARCIYDFESDGTNGYQDSIMTTNAQTACEGKDKALLRVYMPEGVRAGTLTVKEDDNTFHFSKDLNTSIYLESKDTVAGNYGNAQADTEVTANTHFGVTIGGSDLSSIASVADISDIEKIPCTVYSYKNLTVEDITPDTEQGLNLNLQLNNLTALQRRLEPFSEEEATRANVPKEVGGKWEDTADGKKVVVSSNPEAVNHGELRIQTIPVYFAEFIKTNEDHTKPLQGAVFKLYACLNKETDHQHTDWGNAVPENPEETGCWEAVTVNGTAKTYTSLADGKVNLGQLSYGDYRLVEIYAPNGYLKPKGYWSFTANQNEPFVLTHHGTDVKDSETVTAEDGTKTVYLSNEETGQKFSFTKVDAKDTNLPLEGVKFRLYECLHSKEEGHQHSDMVSNADAETGECWTLRKKSESSIEFVTNENGYVDFGELPRGEYRLIEWETNEGYQLPKGQWAVTIGDEITILSKGDSLQPAFMVETNSGENSYKLPNRKELDLPLMGAENIPPYTLMGLGVILGAALMWLVSWRKAKRAVK